MNDHTIMIIRPLSVNVNGFPGNLMIIYKDQAERDDWVLNLSSLCKGLYTVSLYDIGISW